VAGRLEERTALVTGAASGIGRATALLLAKRGADLCLCDIDTAGLEETARDARSLGRDVLTENVDVSDAEAMRSFAAAVHERFDRLDLLLNNAGVMVPPAGKTKQGFELQFGVNHLAHFALTGLLLDLLLSTEGARVVNVSSQAHRFGKMDFDDLDFEARGYNARAAYGQSKLANLLFTFELARRLEGAGAGLKVAAAHPGWTQTNLQKHSGLFQLLNPLFGMQPPGGALPTLRAATADDVSPGDYFGPKGFYEMRGAPKKVASTEAARSRSDAERLWQVSEDRTGVRFDFAWVATPA